MTQAEARALLTVLIAAFPNEAIERPTFDLYAAQLENLGASAARVAIERIVQAGKRFPTVAEIREVYFPIRKAELEREANERGLPEAEVALVDLSDIRSFADRIGRPLPEDEHREAARKLRSVDAGKCDDCDREGERVRYGSRSLCRPCALPRIRVRAQVEDREATA